jgi:hypothetical protein
VNPRRSVICPACGAQCAAAVATAHGWTDDACPKCPPAPGPDHPHSLVVAFGWWPDYPEAHPDARHVYTATCGCGWSAAANSEHHAWQAGWEHAGALDVWAARPLLDRPRPDTGPRDRRRMRWEIEAARLLGIPMRTLMACRDDGSGRQRHPCRGVGAARAWPGRTVLLPLPRRPRGRTRSVPTLRRLHRPPRPVPNLGPAAARHPEAGGATHAVLTPFRQTPAPAIAGTQVPHGR